MPVMSGIDKSNKTTSGLSWWNFLTPDWPSSASSANGPVAGAQYCAYDTARSFGVINNQYSQRLWFHMDYQILAFNGFKQIDAVCNCNYSRQDDNQDNHQVHM